MTSGIVPEFPTGHILTTSYQIIEPFSAGGFATTYRARDMSFIEGDEEEMDHLGYVIVKQLNPRNSCTMEDALRYFRREARALHKLGNNHHQIPRLISFSFSEPYFYLILEYIEGNNLREEFRNLVQRNTKWNEQQAKDFLVDTLQTLDFMHGNNSRNITIIHRDLTPANLIRRKQDGKIVIIDFGIVRIISGLETGLTNTYTTMGFRNKPYTAPEIEATNPVTVKGSDLYSLGVITIEFLTGNTISELSTSLYETVYQIWHRVKTQFDASLGDVISRMVQYEYPNRYQTAPDILRDLGINVIPERYQKLDHLLSERRWMEANQETYRIILAIATEININFAEYREISLFPSEDLQVMDNIWTNRSNQRYSFSIQKRLMQENDNNPELWGQSLGWKRNNGWLTLEALNNSSIANTPDGYFPFIFQFLMDSNLIKDSLPLLCQRLFSRMNIQ